MEEMNKECDARTQQTKQFLILMGEERTLNCAKIIRTPFSVYSFCLCISIFCVSHEYAVVAVHVCQSSRCLLKPHTQTIRCLQCRCFAPVCSYTRHNEFIVHNGTSAAHSLASSRWNMIPSPFSASIRVEHKAIVSGSFDRLDLLR